MWARKLILFVIAMLLSFFMISSVFAQDAARPTAEVATGSKERKAILDALRKELSPLVSDRVVFVVKHLRVKNRWAWVETYPQSPDGTAKYEPVDALLHKKENEWVVKAMRPCCGECADDPDCADIKRYYRKLMREFPSVPAEIFP